MDLAKPDHFGDGVREMRTARLLRTSFIAIGVLAWLSRAATGQPSDQCIMFVAEAESGAIQKTIALPLFHHIYRPEVSPDARHVAMDGYGDDEDVFSSHVLIVDLETGEHTDLGPGYIPSWSPDGQWIAVSRYAARGVYIRSINGAGERLIDASGRGIRWSPDGRQLSYFRRGNLVIHDPGSGTERELFPADELPYEYIDYESCDWSPDSERICFKARRPDDTNEVASVSVTDDDPQITVLCPAGSHTQDFAWRPDGARILFRELVRPHWWQMLVIDVNGDAPPVRWPHQPADRHNGGMSFSRDGKLLVYISRELGS